MESINQYVMSLVGPLADWWRQALILQMVTSPKCSFLQNMICLFQIVR